MDDLLVSLADAIWKGKRITDLEALISEQISATIGQPQWDVWSHLDQILERLATHSTARLEWHRNHPT